MGSIALLFKIDVFLAGRVLNLIAYLIIIFSIQRIFKDKWGMYVFLAGSASFITIFTTTLTEAIFIAFGFLGLTQLSSKNEKIWVVVLAFFIMTLTRYIGIFTILFLGTHYLRTRKNKHLIATIFLSFLILSYVQIEWMFSNKLPTSVIDPPQVDPFTLAKQTSLAILGHLSFFELDNWRGNMGKFLFVVGLTPMGNIAYNLINRDKPFFITPLNEKTVLLLYFGISYLMTLLLVLFGLGWDHAGWGIQSRYTAPGMVFLLIGLTNSIQLNEEELKKLKLVLLISGSFVLLYTGFIQSLIDYIKESDGLVSQQRTAVQRDNGIFSCSIWN